MRKHIQKSTKAKGFWQPEFIGDILQATTYYWQDLEIEIPETDLSGLEDGDRIYIENDADPLHLIKVHAEDDHVPLSGDNSNSPGAVIWVENNEIHYIFHEEE